MKISNPAIFPAPYVRAVHRASCIPCFRGCAVHGDRDKGLPPMHTLFPQFCVLFNAAVSAALHILCFLRLAHLSAVTGNSHGDLPRPAVAIELIDAPYVEPDVLHGLVIQDFSDLRFHFSLHGCFAPALY